MGDVVRIRWPDMCSETFIDFEYFCGLHGLKSGSLFQCFGGTLV